MEKMISGMYEIYKTNISEIHSITKNGNAIVTIYTPFALPSNKVIISRRNFNKIMMGSPINGAIVKVPDYDIPMFKTLSF
jgi:hypothetical protein